ncbi:MAG TPA: bifunctional diaminohydroxyphosphoribosylaminopyrimidine deaminase/5-amino-6-(5-phosphoribosylamino)uracil reductase RibD [Longimicrobiales bacterium]|nr:bifunctional diaminohydroxyphosphoribosylaminopyrimidine deaminase/5-amino-6-(5-phosphoribosylamino)uracil reductase RibD [Longimicrobiales bacterium]
MRRALALAERGWARTRPNPMVGAVLVQGGEVIAEGWHAEYGGPHAEVAALDGAGERARGATLYVSLEPCNHHGRTPPCTDAVVRSGVGRVVVAALDPNPVARGGIDRLRAAGIEVVTGVEEDAARALNAAFFHRHEQNTTFTALKLAISLDGRLSARAGERTAITGAAANAAVQSLRAGFDAILIGAGTARADDPLLTARGTPQPRTPPLRVVIDSGASLDPGSRLVRTAHEAPVAVFCTSRAPDDAVAALESAGVRVRRVVERNGRVDVGTVLGELHAAGVHALLCEGGGVVAAELLSRGLVNRLHLFVAPRFLGAQGTPAFPLAAPLPDEWRLVRERAYGNDVELVYDRLKG